MGKPGQQGRWGGFPHVPALFLREKEIYPLRELGSTATLPWARAHVPHWAKTGVARPRLRLQLPKPVSYVRNPHCPVLARLTEFLKQSAHNK